MFVQLAILFLAVTVQQSSAQNFIIVNGTQYLPLATSRTWGSALTDCPANLQINGTGKLVTFETTQEMIDLQTAITMMTPALTPGLYWTGARRLEDSPTGQAYWETIAQNTAVEFMPPQLGTNLCGAIQVPVVDPNATVLQMVPCGNQNYIICEPYPQ